MQSKGGDKMSFKRYGRRSKGRRGFNRGFKFGRGKRLGRYRSSRGGIRL